MYARAIAADLYEVKPIAFRVVAAPADAPGISLLLGWT
jgi:hypothetical protein